MLIIAQQIPLDRFPGEFYQQFKNLLMPNLLQVINTVSQNPRITWYPLDGSHIVLIPKKETPTSPADFKPISLINRIQRIFFKILAMRL